MREKAKNAFKHKVELFGKTVPTMILVGLFLAGSGSAALLSTFGTVGGTADVSQAILVNGEPKSDIGTVDGFDSFAAGTYRVADLNSGSGYAMQVESNASTATSVTVDTQYDGTDKEEGIVAQNIVYKSQDASNYDVVVGDEDAIVEAIQNETSRILVEPGDYTLTDTDEGDIDTGSSNTVLASEEGPAQTTLELDQETIEAGGSDSLTVKGFNFTGAGNQGGDGFILHSNSGQSSAKGSLTVEHNIFDTTRTEANNYGDSREYRYVRPMNVQDVGVSENFFTGNSDTGVEVNAKYSGANIQIYSNTFAGLADKGIALRASKSTGTLEVSNNNFVFNSDAAIETKAGLSADWSEHKQFQADGNYFSHTGILVEDKTDTDGVSDSLLSEANSPQDEVRVSLQPRESVEVVQSVYFATALEPRDYNIQTKVTP